MINNLEKEIYEYWQRQPCGGWHSDHPVGSKEYFLEVSEFRRRTINEIESVPRDTFVNFEGWKNKRVLEIGCGIGTEAVRFAEGGAIYTGIDISDHAVEIAQHRFDLFNLPGTFKVLNGTEDLSSLGKFDLVYSCGVIHHWPDINKFISNIHNLLEDNGRFIFIVYARPSWDYVMSKTGYSQYEAQNDCPYVDVYSEEEIRNFLGDRFEITDIVQQGCFMYNVEQYRKKNLVLEPWFEAMPEGMRETIDRQLGKYFYVNAKKV